MIIISKLFPIYLLSILSDFDFFSEIEYIKRDDLSGMQLSGNKVRKLEFLMADAVSSGADCVITVGGIQSNHCRATAVAARYLNLDSYLILRTSKVSIWLHFLDEDELFGFNISACD